MITQKRPDRTLGGVHDEFWGWCSKDELRLQRCSNCERLSWPPVEICGTCGGDTFHWELMSGEARVVSWCTFERDYYDGLLPIPWDTIMVELREGPLMISNPYGFTWTDIIANMPVRLIFIDCEDSSGAFRLPVFAKL